MITLALRCIRALLRPFAYLQALSRSAEAKNLNRAISETQLINVAIGILMNEQGRTRQEAFQRLRAIRRPENIKLGETARSIVDSFESSLRAKRRFERAAQVSAEENTESGAQE